jgi:uncharacterized iron-regulated membrane protein
VISNSPPAAESSQSRLYRAVWRWHFYAGLFVIPFLLVLSLTGMIYLFKPQLDVVMYRDLLFVPPGSGAVSYGQQVEAVQQVYPQATVTKVVPRVAPDRSTEIQLTTAAEQKLAVFVNPYTGQVLGDRHEENNLQAIVRKIHGELMIGKTGDYLVELAACWTLVLLITGLFLWLPRRDFKIAGTLIPRLWSKNKQIFWRDLHAVPGFYGLLLIGFLVLTGLPWSGFWGETFANVWNRFPAEMWNEVPKSTVLTGALNQQGTQVVPWAVEKMPMPQSNLQANLQEDHQHHGGSVMRGTAAGAVTLDAVIALAEANHAPPEYSVTLPEGETGVYTIAATPGDVTREMTMHVDQYSGQVLADVRWDDYELVPRAVEWGIAVHMGKNFGFANQVLMLVACLIAIGLCVSGWVLWWRRRPQGRLGAPGLVAGDEPMVKIPLAIVAVLGIAFPLVGVSLVAVLVLDYVVLARLPWLRKRLS